jgi:2-succinyl-6-hydroxy-2,4-cyclohexadiene-1-carboxylate synthase
VSRMPAAHGGQWQPFDLRVGGDRLAGARYQPYAGVAASTTDAVVLLHGFTGSHRSWDHIAAALAHTHTVIAFDLPGHGDSDFGDAPERHSMAHTATAFDEAFATLAIERARVVGYSLGGRVALYLAATRPQRIARLVLESASPGLETEVERRARRDTDEQLAGFALQHGIDAFVDRWETTPVLAAERTLPAATQHALRRQRLRCSPLGLAASLRGMGTGTQPWLGDDLAHVAVPTLLIAGGDDAKFVAIARAMHNRLPNARLAVVPDAGHNVHLQQPDRFTALITAFMPHQKGGTHS